MQKLLLVLLSLVSVRALAPSTAVAPSTGALPMYGRMAADPAGSDGSLPRTAGLRLDSPSLEALDSAVNSVGMEFVRIAPGTYEMGRVEGGESAWSRHRVTLSRGFWIGRFEVSAAELEDLRREDIARGNRMPADRVAWRDAIRFLNAMSRQEGLEPCYSDLGEVIGDDPYACEGYRLPTEAEWEYAARAGTSAGEWEGDRTPGPWAWYGDNCDPEVDGRQPSGLRRANPWGLHDMQGNVREWVHDRWEPGTAATDRTDPSGPTDGWTRVVRGGRCASSARGVSTTHRVGIDASERTAGTGFRAVLTVR